MDLLPLTFFDHLPRNPTIQAATTRIKDKIQLGQERFETGQEVPETQRSHWADENELKTMIESVHKAEQNTEHEEIAHFRIRLMETETINLFEMPCVGYFEGTKQAEEAAYYNEVHQKYEARKASVRVLTSNGACQTEVPLLLRKCLQTRKVQSKDIGCTVTEWDMMDSFKKLDRKYRKKDMASKRDEMSCTERFLTAAQIIQRLFASNNFNYQQLVYSSQPCEIGRCFKYTLRILWKMKEAATGEVNHIATNPINKKLIAVGYGDRRKDGTVCVWNAKNPHNPEKKVSVQHAVTSTAFSKETPYYLAAVTEAGDVLIVDVRKCSPQIRIVSSTVTNVIKDPLWSVSWISHKDLQKENEKVVTVGDSGVVMLWDPHDMNKSELGRLTYDKVPHDKMFVHKHHGTTATTASFMRSTFRVVDIDLDPTDDKTYYASTTQGSLVICKTSIILGPPTPIPAHRGAVLGVKHSPAVPLVYLTHGADAKTILWVHGVKPPIATLTTESLVSLNLSPLSCPASEILNKTVFEGRNTSSISQCRNALTSAVFNTPGHLCGVLDPVICALWSPSHCSVILTLNRKTICLWDIRRSNLDPMTIVFAEEDVHFTTAAFNESGTVVFVGSSDGTTTAFNLHEMPHPPYLQKNHLLSAFKKILWRNKALYDEVDFILSNN